MKFKKNESGELVKIEEVAKTPLEVLEKKARKYKSFRVQLKEDELWISDMSNAVRIRIHLASFLGFDINFEKTSARINSKKQIQFFADVANFYKDWEVYDKEVSK